MPTEEYCPGCGRPPIGEEVQTEEAWLDCLDVLPDYVAHLPAGKIEPIYGSIVWIDAYGKHLSREEFILRHDVDPVPAWAAIKAYRAKYGGGIRARPDV